MLRIHNGMQKLTVHRSAPPPNTPRRDPHLLVTFANFIRARPLVPFSQLQSRLAEYIDTRFSHNKYEFTKGRRRIRPSIPLSQNVAFLVGILIENPRDNVLDVWRNVYERVAAEKVIVVCLNGAWV